MNWPRGCDKGRAGTGTEYTDFASAETINATEGLIAGPFYVIPQTVGTDDNAFNISFTAKVTDGTTVYKEGSVTAVVPVGEHGTWTAQNYYQYSAVINMTNINDPDTPDEELQPIEFTVTVGDWATVVDVPTTLNDVEP